MKKIVLLFAGLAMLLSSGCQALSGKPAPGSVMPQAPAAAPPKAKLKKNNTADNKYEFLKGPDKKVSIN